MLLCLSIDIDWAHDAVIADTLALVEAFGAKATWFATHATPALAAIRAAGGHELGLHPNFNPVLDGGQGRAAEVMRRITEIVPDSVSVRSHSLVRSSRLAELFVRFRQTHESNHLLPPVVAARLNPWRDWSGLVQVPIRWEDDVRLLDPTLGEPADLLGHVEPLIVDFHPIHVFLNSRSIADYEAARGDAQRPADLLKRRLPPGAAGSRDRLAALLSAAREAGARQCRVRDFAPGREHVS